jgi:predicted PurR-regulated permease PerM
VNQAIIWGIAAGELNTIPYFGAIIVSTGLALVAFLQFGTITQALYISGSAALITALEGYILTPMLMGRAARINQVALFVGILFWSWMWGMAGMILAVPMMMVIKSVCDRVEGLYPVAELLGEAPEKPNGPA